MQTLALKQLRPVLAAACLLAAGPAPADGVVRVVSWNVAMGLEHDGALAQRLSRDDDPALLQLADVLRMLRPDLLLLNEFDHHDGVDAAGLLREHYLSRDGAGGRALDLSFDFSAAVNTGVDSGLDLDRDGQLHGPADAWGYGRFPGQYGMLVLSRWRIAHDATRSFRLLRWSAVPGALRPRLPDGSEYYPDEVWTQLRLSSKSHWDLPVVLPGGGRLHLLASHPTPPAFDGPEDRNGRRNHDEIRLWADYLDPQRGGWLVDDAGVTGPLTAGAPFVVAGDLNADPVDGDDPGAIAQLLDHAAVDAGCTPASAGGSVAAAAQGGANLVHQGDPAQDTADFSDAHAGNLRVDYLLPARGLDIIGCGVFWPAPGTPAADWVGFTDHRPVWLDLRLPVAGTSTPMAPMDDNDD